MESWCDAVENQGSTSPTSEWDEIANEMICELRKFHTGVNSVVVPLIDGAIQKSSCEKAIAGTFLRMKQLVSGLCVLDDPQHFQITNAVARTVFELCLDLHALSKDPSIESKFWSFTQVSRFHKTQQLVSFLEGSPSVDRSAHADAIRYASDPARKTRIEALVRTHWGTDRKGKLRWPDHWSGQLIFSRAKNAGVKYEEFYKTHFSYLSNHVHAGIGGIQGLSQSALICCFAIAIYLTRDLFEDSVNIVIDAFRLSEADGSLKERLKEATGSSKQSTTAFNAGRWGQRLIWSNDE